jgi:hypothetical protein
MVETINIFSCNSHMMLEIRIHLYERGMFYLSIAFLSGLWHQYHQFYSGAVSGIENKHLIKIWDMYGSKI